MSTTMNLTRTGRLVSGKVLSGTLAQPVNAVDVLDQIVSAGTEEEAAMGAFKDRQLQSLTLRCDQDAVAQFLGVRYPILDLNVVGPDTITFTGDLEQEIFDGDLVRIEDTVADDGIYQVAGVAEAIGVTTLTIADGIPWPAGGGGAVGTFARVASQQRMGYTYNIATATLATGQITIAGDVSDKFAAGDAITIVDSTGNDGYWVLLTVVTDGPPVTTTTLTVVGALLPDNTDDGNLYKVRAGFVLPENVPFLWDVDSGLANPFIHPGIDTVGLSGQRPFFDVDRGDVNHCMVRVPGATNGQFDGLVAKNPVLL